MGTTIDNRVVAMKFDNAQFERGIRTTTASLGELNKGLQLQGVGKGIDTIASKFTAFHVAGFTAIQEITKGLINMGKTAVNAMLSPLIEGGKKRALSIEQAKFQFKGLGMDVEATMASALTAVKGTAFGLDEAAMAAAMFGASGLRAGEEMTKALRGISGIAAMSGSSYADIADVFTTVAGQGRLMGNDLNRLATRGVNAAATLGKAMGKTEVEIRKMVTKGEIDFKTFARIMDDSFGEHATKASETYSGSLKNLKAAFARIGAKHFTNQFEALRRIFVAFTPVVDGVAKALGPIIDVIGKQMLKSADGISAWLSAFDFRDAQNWLAPLARSFTNVFDIVNRVAKPLLNVFRYMFPPKTGRDILLFSMSFEKLIKKLEPSVETINAITVGFRKFLGAIKIIGKTIGDAIDFKIVFKGMFAIFSLAGKSIRFVIEALYSFVDAFFITTGVAGGFVKNLGKIVEGFFQFFINLDASADKTKIFSTALDKVRNTLKKIAVPFKAVAEWINNLVSKFIEIIGPLDPIAAGFNAAGNAATFFSKIIEAMAAVVGTIIKVLKPLTDMFAEAIDGATLDDVLKTLLTGTTIAFLGSINGFITKFFALFRGQVPNYRFFFNELAFEMKAFSASITAKVVKEIAISILILAAAMFILASIDADAAVRGAAGIGAILAMLTGFLQANKTLKSNGLSSTAVTLTALSVALFILSGVVKKLGELKPEVLQQGLIAVAAVLGGFAIFSKIISADKGMLRTGIGFIMFAIALRILSKVLATLGEMDSSKLTQAMITLGLIFGAVAGFSRAVNPAKFVSMVIGMILLATSIKILASALKTMAKMSWEEISRGLVAMTGGLVLMVGAMNLMPKGSMTKAAGLLVVSAAIYILGKALNNIGAMSWNAVVKSLVGVGVALGLIVAFLKLTGDPKTLLGAVALSIVSVALLALASVLKTIGGMPVEAIAAGLGAIALAFAIIIAAGYAATGALVGLLGLGVALLMISGAMFIAGVGIGLFAAGLAVLFKVIGAGGPVLIDFLVSFANSLPEIAKSIAKAIGSFAEELTKQQVKITKALTMLLEAALDGLIPIIPKAINLVSILIDGFLKIVVEKTPLVIQAVIDMLVSIMEAIRDNIGNIVTIAGEIVIAFLDALGDHYVKIAAAGADFIIKLIKGIADNQYRIIKAAMKTLLGFIEGIRDAVKKYGPKIESAAAELLNEFLYRLGHFVGTMNFLSVGSQIVNGVIAGIKSSTKNLSGPIKTVVNGALGLFNKHSIIKSPSKLFMPVGKQWVAGIVVGLDKSASVVSDSAKSVVNSAYSAMQLAGSKAIDVFDNLAEPTITPVVDLDDVYKSAKSIGSIMGNISAAKLTGEVSARLKPPVSTQQATDTASNAETTFIQNNYSPKALSRLEIYRQTHNQLLQLKGLGG